MVIDFLVIGVQKSATSWLYYCLNEHPEVVLPGKKREVEYIGGPLYKSEGGISWYYSLFGRSNTHGKKIGDISVEYFYSQDAPSEICKHLPECKFILLLRNPTERFQSAYFWYLRKGLIDPKTNIKEQVLKAISVNQEDKDLGIVGDLLGRGYYEKQLDNYFAEFSPGHFHVVFFEDLSLHPQKSLSDIYSFIGVDANFTPQSIDSKPKRNSYSTFLIFIERVAGKYKIVSKFADFTNQLLARFSKNQFKSKVFDKELTNILDIHFKAMNSGLSAKLQMVNDGKKHSESISKYWNW